MWLASSARSVEDLTVWVISDNGGGGFFQGRSLLFRSACEIVGGAAHLLAVGVDRTAVAGDFLHDLFQVCRHLVEVVTQALQVRREADRDPEAERSPSERFLRPSPSASTATFNARVSASAEDMRRSRSASS